MSVLYQNTVYHVPRQGYNLFVPIKEMVERVVEESVSVGGGFWGIPFTEGKKKIKKIDWYDSLMLVAPNTRLTMTITGIKSDDASELTVWVRRFNAEDALIDQYECRMTSDTFRSLIDPTAG